ncbi:hypothetical protein AB0876_22995 [Mycobacterium sp. NPDC049093]
MRITVLSVLGAVSVAGSVIVAPLAGATPGDAPAAVQHIQPAPQTCNFTNAGSVCVSPGNAQINDAPPFVNNFPMYGSFPWIL